MYSDKFQPWQQLKQHPGLRRFFQGGGEQKQPYYTNGRNVYILPTRSGIAFAVILLVMLVGAINYNNSLGYLFTFFLGSMSIVTILHTYRNVLRLEIRLGKPHSVFCGETAMVPVYISQQQDVNRYALCMNFSITPSASLQKGLNNHTASENNCDILKDLSATKGKFHLPLHTDKRGLCKVPRFTLASRFPLGLFRSWTPIHLQQTFIVYPRPAPSAPDLPATHYLPDQEGDQGKGTDDFTGLRNYQRGDSLSHIHWKAFARQRIMITKQFGGDRSDEAWFDWDSLSENSTETRLSILTRWVLNADRERKIYGLKLPGQIIKPSTGPRHRQRCLEALALFGL